MSEPIRYYPDIIAQNAKIQKRQAKLGYTPTTANRARKDIMKTTKGKQGWNMLMKAFQHAAPDKSKLHERPQTDSMAQSLLANLNPKLASQAGQPKALTSSAKSAASSAASVSASESASVASAQNAPVKMHYKSGESHNPVRPHTPYGDKLMFGPGWTCPTLGGSRDMMDMPVKQALYRRYQIHKDHAKWTGKAGKAAYLKAIQDLAKNPQSKRAKQDSKFIKLYTDQNSKAGQKAYEHRMTFWLGQFQHGLSLADMTPFIYKMCATNPNSIAFWFPPLMKAYDKSDHFFRVPKTKIWRLPMEIAQYLQTDYLMTNQKSRDMFNKLCMNVFDLDPNKSYFIKTGVFSGKYEFANAHCTQPDQMGEYFHVINNFAMSVGASTSVDLCVREWIPDVDHHPKIYNGMPLRTEFRSFVDFDKGRVIGIVPYWAPAAMDMVLSHQALQNKYIKRDYQVYRQNLPRMMKEYNAAIPKLKPEITKLIQHAQEPLHGKWSLDIMQSGGHYYLIDMALMNNSALRDLIPKYNH